MAAVRRPYVSLAASLACILVVAPSVYGKGDVRASLENPAQLQRVAPGERVRVAWTLTEGPQLPSRAIPRRVGPRPFGAGRIYIRVSGAAGGKPRIFTATSQGGSQLGHYVAEVTVPAGGIGAIAIGLEGFMFGRGPGAVRADVFFPIANDPFAHHRRNPGHPVQPQRGGIPVGVLLAGVLSVLGVLLVGYRTLLARRTARHRPLAMG